MPPTRAATLASKRRQTENVQPEGGAASKRKKLTVLRDKKSNAASSTTQPFVDATNAVEDKRKQRIKLKTIQESKKGPTVRTNRATQLRNRKLPLSSNGASSDENSSQDVPSSQDSCTSQENSHVSCSSQEASVKKEPVSPPTPDGHKRKQRDPPPTGITDFDSRFDYFGSSDTVKDIFEYFSEREVLFICPPYMEQRKPQLSEPMRAILVDWMVEMQESFELTHETLYLAVKLMDIYLSKKEVLKNKLQLVGAACMFISAKYEERVVSTPMLDDVKYICEDTYSQDEIKAMERDVFRTIGFDLGMPTSYTFLRRMARTNGSSNRELTLARYILETSLMDYSLSVGTLESLKAAGALYLARKMTSEASAWTASLTWHSGISEEALLPYATRLHSMLKGRLNPSLKVVRNKYSHEVFQKVATIPVPVSLS
ncbi:unnamed protein product [Cyprideis torosa]|uniref:G2/mitotic-specific cyclin-B3 n=1 Tax=Cyprideis torosa TaxID=163714 RepID=A0A7R8WMK0_9CRUS|nr:unnamed protein product [Cyprideis torosa]CAG0903766.1 unnamed protein product [Cyprideis torosa]